MSAAATLAVPLEETRRHLASPTLGDTTSRLDDGRRARVTLTSTGLTLEAPAADGRPARTVAVDLVALANLMGDAL